MIEKRELGEVKILDKYYAASIMVRRLDESYYHCVAVIPGKDLQDAELNALELAGKTFPYSDGFVSHSVSVVLIQRV